MTSWVSWAGVTLKSSLQMLHSCIPQTTRPSEHWSLTRSFGKFRRPLPPSVISPSWGVARTSERASALQQERGEVPQRVGSAAHFCGHRQSHRLGRPHPSCLWALCSPPRPTGLSHPPSGRLKVSLLFCQAKPPNGPGHQGWWRHTL